MLPVKIGLIGCGGIVQKTHLPCLIRLREQARIVSVADPIAASRDWVGEHAGIAPEHRFMDFQPMLDEGGLELVLVATPHHIHASAIRAAARAGIAVISEKPMAPDLGGAQQVLAGVQAAGVPFSVVHNFLYSPGNREALRQLSINAPAGETSLFARGQSLFSKPEPLDPEDWRSRVEAGGGALADTCYHEIYQIEALAGSPIVRVQAHISTIQHHITADDLVLLTLTHRNGMRSTINTSWSIVGYEGSFCEVHTNHRAIRVEGRGRRLRTYSRSDRAWNEVVLRHDDDPGVASGHAGFWQACLTSFRAGHALPISLDHALRQVAILEAARESSRRAGAPVDVSADVPAHSNHHD